jgi:3-hydroxyisobutyrate dehydrogenase-like beta-hydroxyacid dehydrogenase
MERKIAFIGFGEAARAFAAGRARDVAFSAYDLTSDVAMRAAFAEADVAGAERPQDALAGVEAALSLVTADQALAAARDYARHLASGALWLDMNSVAPETKRLSAAAVENAGGRYVDVAVMAPVHPAGRAAPLLVSGPHAAAGVELLESLGFTKVRAVEGGIGAASAVKMIRSVLVKGLEALTAECILAAEAAGVRSDVLASLDASDRAMPWAERADYALERMLIHGARRAAEMEEAAKTLETLGVEAALTRGTIQRQREIGAIAQAAPAGLDAKLAVILHRKAKAA